MSSVATHLGRTKTNNFSSIDVPILDKFCIGKRVLDIGCANGDVVKYLISKGTEAYGIDGDTDAVNLYADDSVKQSLFCHDYTLGPSNFKKKLMLCSQLIFVNMLRNNSLTITCLILH